ICLPVRAPGPGADLEKDVLLRNRVRTRRRREHAPPSGSTRLGVEVVERLLEAVRVRALRLRERLEPVGDLVEAFVASRLGHAGVRVGVLGRLAGARRLEVLGGCADRQARGRIADRLEVLEMAVRMTRLTFGRRAEYGRDVVIA